MKKNTKPKEEEKLAEIQQKSFTPGRHSNQRNKLDVVPEDDESQFNSSKKNIASQETLNKRERGTGEQP